MIKVGNVQGSRVQGSDRAECAIRSRCEKSVASYEEYGRMKEKTTENGTRY